MKALILVAVLFVVYTGALEYKDVAKFNPLCAAFTPWKYRLNYFDYGAHIYKFVSDGEDLKKKCPHLIKKINCIVAKLHKSHFEAELIKDT